MPRPGQEMRKTSGEHVRPRRTRPGRYHPHALASARNSETVWSWCRTELNWRLS